MATHTRISPIDRVFPCSTKDQKTLSSQLARLVVLHEDLRIAGESFLKISRRNRRRQLAFERIGSESTFYLRSLVATLAELAKCIKGIDGTPAFKRVLREFDPEAREFWADAVLQIQRGFPLLRDIRNEVSSHFDEKAAAHALVNLEKAREVVKLHYDDRRGLDCRHLAGVVAVAAVYGGTRDRDDPLKSLKAVTDELGIALDAMKKAVYVLVGQILWDRTGKG